jgi:Mg-chelatase subunit ChlD
MSSQIILPDKFESAIKILKLHAQSVSEAKLNNLGAASLFENKRDELLTKHNLTLNQVLDFEIEQSKLNDGDSGKVKFENKFSKNILTNPFINTSIGNIKKNNLNKRYNFTKLAETIANHYNCKVIGRERKGEVAVYGFDLERDVVNFMTLALYEVMYANVELDMSKVKSNVGMDAEKVRESVKKDIFGSKTKADKVVFAKWIGDKAFEDSWMEGFRLGIAEVLGTCDSFKLMETEKLMNEFSYTPLTGDSYHDRYYRQMEKLADLKENESYVNDKVMPVIEIGKETGVKVLKMRQSKIDSTPTSTSTIIKNPTLFKKSSSTALTLGNKGLAKKKGLNLTSSNVNSINSMSTNSDIVYILIDNSGSMYGEKIQFAKEGAINYAQSAIEKGYAVGVITFESRVEHIISPTKVIDDRFKNKVREITDKGGTHLTEALSMAKGYFLNRMKKRVVMVITDGMPANEMSAIAIANEMKREGIEIMAIGTDDARKEFLDRLCSNAGLGLLVERGQLLLGIGEMAKNLK